MKQHIAPKIIYVANKKKVVHVRLKLMTLMLSARMQYLLKKKEVVFVRLKLMTLTLQHNAAWRSSTQTNFNSAQTDILRTQLYNVELAQASPNYVAW